MLTAALLAFLLASTLNQDETPTPTPEPLPWEISTPTPPGRPACPATPPAWWGQETPSPGWYFRCGHCVGSWPGQVPFPSTPTPLFRATLPPVGMVTPTPSPTPTRLPGCTWKDSWVDRVLDRECVYLHIRMGHDNSTAQYTWYLYPLGISGGNGYYTATMRMENFKVFRLVWWVTGRMTPLGGTLGTAAGGEYLSVGIEGGYGVIGNPPVMVTYRLNSTIYPGTSNHPDGAGDWSLWTKFYGGRDSIREFELLARRNPSGSVSGSASPGSWMDYRVYYDYMFVGTWYGDAGAPPTLEASGDFTAEYWNPYYVGGGDLPPITPTPPPSFGATPTPGPGDGGGGGEIGDPSLCLDPNPGQQVEILPIPRYFGDYCVSVGPVGPYNIPLVGEVRVPLVKVCFRPTSFGTFDFLGFRFNADLFLGTLVGFALIRFLWG